MGNEQRFFFVCSGAVLFPLAFVFGVVVVPLVCGTRYLCVKLCSPKEPTKPTDPDKPNKPAEPAVGASAEEWNSYRANLTEYRKRKEQWKEDSIKHAGSKSRLLKEYEEKQKEHQSKVSHYKAKQLMPAKQLLCNSFTTSTTSVFFCKQDTPELVKKLLAAYFN